MKTNRFFCFFSLLVIVAAFAEIVFRLHFWVLPLLFFAVGLVSALWKREHSLYLFVFLFPFINASPALFDNGYPFNYMAVSLFLLSGIVVAAVIRKVRSKEGSEVHEEYLDRDFQPYYLFLLFLVISGIFVLLRWSNLTLGSAGAMGADTPVSPPAPDLLPNENVTWNEQRISFASIFPVVSLFIYFISPFIFFYTRKLKPEEGKIFTWLSYGFYVSVGFAVAQKIAGRSLISDRLGKEFKQFYGGFSDFNAFGFFSGVMFLWSTYRIREKSILGYVTFLVGLTGGILSGSRTVYFFILAGMVNLVFGFYSGQNRQKHRKIIVAVLAAVVVLLVVFAGGTLKNRFTEGFSGDQDLMEKLNTITNGRVWMTLFTLETVKDNFIPGVGTGNFSFYLAYRNYLPYRAKNERYLYDLTLNQYLLVFAENGIFAFLFFTFFMVFLFRRSVKKLLIGTILFSLLLNNFFWFPEAFLLFWILAALNHTGGKEQEKQALFSDRNKKIGAALVLLLFIVFNVVTFNALHPRTWAVETGIRYDYGFWYPEKDEAGNEFRWTGERAGLYITLDKNGESSHYRIVCGAPLAHMQEKEQTVEVYWKGKLYKEFTFTENKEIVFKMKSKPSEGGFLEVKVLPAFKLKELGLGPETRDLGVRINRLN
jgi:hypothetical protein